jgi:hypothetical protein
MALCAVTGRAAPGAQCCRPAQALHGKGSVAYRSSASTAWHNTVGCAAALGGWCTLPGPAASSAGPGPQDHSRTQGATPLGAAPLPLAGCSAASATAAPCRPLLAGPVPPALSCAPHPLPPPPAACAATRRPRQPGGRLQGPLTGCRGAQAASSSSKPPAVGRCAPLPVALPAEYPVPAPTALLVALASW